MSLQNLGRVVGSSAYEIAVRKGYVGSEEEWLQSLQGATPQKGVDYWTEDDITELVAQLNKGLVYTDDSRLSDSRPASDVSDWAKQSTKPTYTASEVGALPNTTIIPSTEGLATEDYVKEYALQKTAASQTDYGKVATVGWGGGVSYEKPKIGAYTYEKVENSTTYGNIRYGCWYDCVVPMHFLAGLTLTQSVLDADVKITFTTVSELPEGSNKYFSFYIVEEDDVDIPDFDYAPNTSYEITIRNRKAMIREVPKDKIATEDFVATAINSAINDSWGEEY